MFAAQVLVLAASVAALLGHFLPELSVTLCGPPGHM